MDIIEQHLKNVFDETKTLPFLFVGSGISKRYFDAPNWEDLLNHVASRTFENDLEYRAIIQKAKSMFDIKNNYNEYMCAIADLLEENLITKWYTDSKYEDIRNKHLLEIEENTLPIKIEIAEYLKNITNPSMFNENKLQEIESLKKLKDKSLAGVITTNYDSFLENIFNFEVYRSQNELLFNQTYNTHEIYKIHGCLNKPQTIAITSQDYKEIDAKNHYLAAKLLTIFMEHPIIFLGYSMEDLDIRKILGSIVDFLPESKKKVLEKRMIFIKWDDTALEPQKSTIQFQFEQNKTISMTTFTLADYSDLYNIIHQYKSTYSPKILRSLKKDMYSMLLTTDPGTRLQVAIHENENGEVPDDIEYYFGFGIMELAKRGYKIIQPLELYKDIVFDHANYQKELLVKETLSDCLMKSGGYLPYRKYIVDVPYEELPRNVKNNLARFDSFKAMLPDKLYKQKELGETTFESAVVSSDKIANLATVNYDESNIELLGDFLRNLLNKENFIVSSEVKRLIRIYDYIKYR